MSKMSLNSMNATLEVVHRHTKSGCCWTERNRVPWRCRLGPRLWTASFWGYHWWSDTLHLLPLLNHTDRPGRNPEERKNRWCEVTKTSHHINTQTAFHLYLEFSHQPLLFVLLDILAIRSAFIQGEDLQPVLKLTELGLQITSIQLNTHTNTHRSKHVELHIGSAFTWLQFSL